MSGNSHLFKPGQSGNPSGRPKQNPDAVAILKAAVPDAVRRLVALSQSDNEKIALQAATAILDRVWGKPMQAQEIRMEASMDLRSEVRAALLERARAAGCNPTDQASEK